MIKYLTTCTCIHTVITNSQCIIIIIIIIIVFFLVNCLDRHARESPDRVAVIWEKDEAKQHENVTYK